jgi:phospholipid-binding lipoprotein MlaA
MLPAAAAVLVALASPAAAREISDPIEPVNRGIFWFNDQADVYVLEPAARGWNYVLPNRMQSAIANFFDNVRFPVVMINNLLQAKFVDAASDTGRFVINTTLGVAGFFDPATDFGLERSDEDFGQTLGYWGVPPGPYLVVPLLGPTNLRDGVGRLVDTATAVYPLFAAFEYTIGATVTNSLNFRSQVIKQVRDAKRAALDYYVFMRDAYDQNRQARVEDRSEISAESAEELYFEDFDDEQSD